jgi:hypothetical protein
MRTCATSLAHIHHQRQFPINNSDHRFYKVSGRQPMSSPIDAQQPVVGAQGLPDWEKTTELVRRLAS